MRPSIGHRRAVDLIGENVRKHLRLASLLTAVVVGSSFLSVVPAAADTGADGTGLTPEEITALIAEVAPAPINATQTNESS